MAINYVRAQIDVIRVVAEASIGSTYTALGAPFANQVRIICITNNTNGDLFLSVDGVNDHLFIPKNSFRLYDIGTNQRANDPGFFFQVNTQFYVRYSSMPSSGSVYLEAIWGN